MRERFKSKAISSFYLWLDHTILDDGKGYKNVESVFYSKNDYQFPSLATFSSPYKQWVWDSSVSGANVPSGISGENGFILRGTDGLKIDYLNGRIIFDNGISGNYSGSYAIKDFNIYLTNEKEEDIVFENKYQYNPRIGKAYSGIEPYDIVLPAIFINNSESVNEPFSFGGEDDTRINIRAIIITKNTHDLINLSALLEDKTRTCFPLLSTEDIPLNIYGDFKNGSGYNYEELSTTSRANNNPLVFIERVSYSQLQGGQQQKNELVGFVNFELSTLRYPRLE